jgi:hypothetical protein
MRDEMNFRGPAGDAIRDGFVEGLGPEAFRLAPKTLSGLSGSRLLELAAAPKRLWRSRTRHGPRLHVVGTTSIRQLTPKEQQGTSSSNPVGSRASSGGILIEPSLIEPLPSWSYRSLIGATLWIELSLRLGRALCVQACPPRSQSTPKAFRRRGLEAALGMPRPLAPLPQRNWRHWGFE